jgi:Zn-dependent protease with chaperone function
MSAPNIDSSKVHGRGIFFDGVTTARHDVVVELAPRTLQVHGVDGSVLSQWSYDELETLSSPDYVLRLGRAGNAVSARLVIKDPQLAAAIDERSLPVDRTGRIDRRLRTKVIFSSVAATASLILVAVVAMPQIATQLTPLVPYAIERRLGAGIDAQTRKSLNEGSRSGVPLECGSAEKEQAGRVAFEKLMRQMEMAARLPLPLKATVMRRQEANAIALPGGHIYVYGGLVGAAQTPDELAGIIAHEFGHVAHRDGTRKIVQDAGLALLSGLFLGDVIGGSAVVVAAKTILRTSYSREIEAAADGYAVGLMSKIGGDQRALATMLSRIAGGTHAGPKILAEHPETNDRIVAIEAMASSTPRRPLLTQTEWAALKAICAEDP